MNGTIPATVNSREGSGDTSDALGTTVWPRSAKCSRKRRRISAVCMLVSFRPRGSVRGPLPRPGSVVGGVPAGRGGRQGPPGAGGARGGGGGQRCVEAGAGAQLGLALGGGGPHVGAEVTDRLGQLAQAVGERAED